MASNLELLQKLLKPYGVKIKGYESGEDIQTAAPYVGMGDVKAAERRTPYTLAERRRIDDAGFGYGEPWLEMPAPNTDLPGGGRSTGSTYIDSRSGHGTFSSDWLQKNSTPVVEMPNPYERYDNIDSSVLPAGKTVGRGQAAVWLRLENVLPRGSFNYNQTETETPMPVVDVSSLDGNEINKNNQGWVKLSKQIKAPDKSSGVLNKTLAKPQQPDAYNNNNPVNYTDPSGDTIRYDLNEASFVNDLALAGNQWAVGMNNEQRLFVDTNSPGVFLSEAEVRQRGLDPATVRPINAPGIDELSWGRPVKSLAELKQLSEAEVLARLIYAEANDKDRGMEAVATSIINRSNDIRYNGANYNTKDPSFYSIVWAPNQYEPLINEYSDPKCENKKAFEPSRNDPAWIKACDLALAMVTGQWQGITNPGIEGMTSFRSYPPKGKYSVPKGGNHFFYGA